MALDNATLSHLWRRIVAIESSGESNGGNNGGNSGAGVGRNVISLGLAAIDTHLPAGGLTGGCVYEIAAALAGRAQRRHLAPANPRRHPRDNHIRIASRDFH